MRIAGRSVTSSVRWFLFFSKGNFMKKHLISWQDWSDDEINDLIDFSVHVKNNRALYSGHFMGRSIAMLFQKTSTRTRVSFEAALTEMGGHALYIDWQSSNFHLSDIEFETEYLSRNVSLIMARLKNHDDLIQMLSGTQVPIINGCCNLFHPCQSLADILTIHNDAGKLKDVSLCYVGVLNNVANSLIEITSACGVHLTLVTPMTNPGCEIKAVMDRGFAKGTLHLETNLTTAIKNCDYIYTDTWIDMEYFNDPEYAAEKAMRIDKMMPYQLNAELLKNSSAKIMHDMPIHPGYEIARELVKDPRSIIFQQAENRLDAQKAAMIRLLGHR